MGVGVDVGVDVGVALGVVDGVVVGVALGVALGVAVGVAVGVGNWRAIASIVTTSWYAPASKWLPFSSKSGLPAPVTPTYQVPAESITKRHSEPRPVVVGFPSKLFVLVSSFSHNADPPPLANSAMKVSGSSNLASSRGVVDTVTMSPTIRLEIPR